MAVAICYRMDACVSIAGIMAISVVAKPAHVRTVSFFNSVCYTYITYYSIAYVTLIACVCTMLLGFWNQIASRQLFWLFPLVVWFMAPKADEVGPVYLSQVAMCSSGTILAVSVPRRAM